MAPKNKYAKEQIIRAGMEILRERGAEAITARAVASRLGSSVAPIFNVFANMEEFQKCLKQRADEIYSEYVAEGLKAVPAFKGVGISYIKFAMVEPNLFRLLFMADGGNFALDNVLMGIDPNYGKILQSVRDSYGFGEEDAKTLYKHMWIYTHGIAVLCVTGTCAFKAEELSGMLTEVCTALIKQIKN